MIDSIYYLATLGLLETAIIKYPSFGVNNTVEMIQQTLKQYNERKR